MSPHFVYRVENFPTYSTRSWIWNMFVFNVIRDILNLFVTIWTDTRSLLGVTYKITLSKYCWASLFKANMYNHSLNVVFSDNIFLFSLQVWDTWLANLFLLEKTLAQWGHGNSPGQWRSSTWRLRFEIMLLEQIGQTPPPFVGNWETETVVPKN